MEWAGLFLGIGIAWGLWCLGCGIEEAGEQIRLGLEALAESPYAEGEE
jgi:F0F1-type ATP synthase membrane subunit c/vacuolar-type H+-ATPase subunit K